MILKLGMQDLVLKFYQIPSDDDPRLTFDLFQLWTLIDLYGKMLKMVDYSETVEVYDIKVGICSKLTEYMEIYMYQRSRSFFDLCLRSLRMKLDLR